MKAVTVAWRWDDDSDEFMEWWTCNEHPTVDKVKETLLLTFHKNVRKHVVILGVQFVPDF